MSDRVGSLTPDVLLVREVRRTGSERAFCLLYDRHTPRLLQTAWRILGGADAEAEDAVQEAWFRAVSTLDGWSGDAPLGAWLRGIVVHVALDALRRSRRLTLDAEVSGAELASAEPQAGAWLDLEAAIASLPPGYRAVLVLHDIEGFTHEEIGVALGISAGTSKGQLFKARRVVRARLDPRPVTQNGPASDSPATNAVATRWGTTGGT